MQVSFFSPQQHHQTSDVLTIQLLLETRHCFLRSTYPTPQQSKTSHKVQSELISKKEETIHHAEQQPPKGWTQRSPTELD